MTYPCCALMVRCEPFWLKIGFTHMDRLLGVGRFSKRTFAADSLGPTPDILLAELYSLETHSFFLASTVEPAASSPM